MLKYKNIFIALAFVFIAGLGIVFYATSVNKNKEIQYLSASWEYNYSDIEEISQSSNLIALVSVESIEDSFVQQSIPYTVFSVNVDTPIYNSEAG
ncbi:MAG TPA: hypothetical protein IAB23_07900 [Candidatus Scybalocola faecavium]|nr:hypothetical protein [Candidatus Scybalocola faecavium]